MFDDAPIARFALVAAVGFAAALARGFSGFGGALIFVPMASALVGPRVAVPVLLLVDGVLALGLIPQAWRLSDRRAVLIMSLGAVVGVPFGTMLLTHMDQTALRWAMVFLALGLLVLLMSGWQFRGQPRAHVTVGVGMIAGLFGGATQMSGPPVVAYWLCLSSTKERVRANIILYFAIATVITFASYVVGGLLTREVILTALIAGPSYAVGLYLGARLFPIAAESTFRRTCYALIAAGTLLSLPALDGVLR